MNKYLLDYIRKSKKKSINEICNAIGISRSAYFRKCNGKSEFTQSEIQGIVKFLDLDTPMGIFFDAKVS